MTLIKSLLIFYPLIVPVWQAGPFDRDNITRAESLEFLTAPAVQFQINTFKEIKDPRIRGRMAIDLINSNNPEAVQGLTFLYDIEKSDSVKADILTALYKMKHFEKSGNSSMLKNCLKNNNSIIRGYGSALYLDKTKDAASVLQILKDEPADFVKNLVWHDMQSFCNECPENQLKEMISGSDILNRANAAKILAMKSTAPDTDSALQKAATDQEPAVRASLADGLSLRKSGGSELLAKLAKDKMVQVRSFVASAAPCPERQNMFISLTTDPDPEVRRLAVVALRHYNETAAINALLAAMNDSFKPARTAAEDSLIFMKPAQEVLERIGREYLDQKPAVNSAVRVLGALKDQRFNAKIEELLNTTEDTDLMRRAINAFASLDYKKSSASVAKKATCKDPLVREAVGNTLGIFNIKDTFNTLVTLSSDADVPASLAAARAMGITKDPYFNNCLLGIMKNVKVSADNRAFACWSQARIGKPDKEIINRLKFNALKKFIPVPMAGPEYDADFARIAACMALIDLGKNSNEARTAAAAVIKVLRTPTKDQGADFVSGETLQEYARQAELYMQGKAIDIMPLPTVDPVMTVKKFDKKE